ncbi:MAG: redoxin domain-containing protein [Meiothermus silvanus]|nr:redoxin domain-containing protein [Allomeiothermus silvanus]
MVLREDSVRRDLLELDTVAAELERYRGVSADDLESHGKFHAKYALNFPLLSDPSTEIIKAYGAWGVKNAYGKEYEGVLRQTFLIDPQGKVAKVWEKVRPDEHALEVAEALSELQKA